MKSISLYSPGKTSRYPPEIEYAVGGTEIILSKRQQTLFHVVKCGILQARKNETLVSQFP
jgi:hypothetical protein